MEFLTRCADSSAPTAASAPITKAILEVGTAGLTGCNEQAVAFFGAGDGDTLLQFDLELLSAATQPGRRPVDQALTAVDDGLRGWGRLRFAWRFVTAEDAAREVRVVAEQDGSGAGEIWRFAVAALEPDRRATVLVVEDNPTNVRVVANMLDKLGCRVLAAEHGGFALDVLAAEPVDMVLMDCMMPVVDGYEATRLIRAGAGSVRDRDVAIVALTANALPGDREKCLAAGMDDYMAKPVRRRLLADMLEAHCGLLTF